MKKLVLLLLFFSQINLWAQPKVDSLNVVLAKIGHEGRGAVLNQLAGCFKQNDSTRCLTYARQALMLSENTKNTAVRGDAFYNMAECYYYYDDYEQALKYYLQALEIYKDFDNKSKIAETYNSLGLVFYYKGEYDKALKNLISALQCLEQSDDKLELGNVYSNMGMVYSRIGDYNMSIENFRKAASFNRQCGNIYGMAISFNGIGVGFYDLEKLDSAKANYKRAYSAFMQLGNRKEVAIALNNIANIFVDEGDSLEKAMDYYNEAYQVFDELNDMRNKVFVIDGLGGVYQAMGDNRKALETFRKGLKLAKKYQIGYYIQQLYYKDIASTYEKSGRIREAYAAYKMYKVYQDSLHQEERMRQVAELEKKYETEKKEAEITKLNSEKEIAYLQIQKDKAVRVFGMVAILMLLAIIIYISFGYYDKKRTNILLNQKNTLIESQKDKLEKINASKNKFFSIIAHDLKNPFHSVMGYSYLLSKEYGRFSEAERQKYAADIYKSTNNIFRLLQNLLDWSRSQTGRLKYEPVPFDFNVLYGNIYNLLRPLADQKRIVLESKIPEKVPVFADPMMVETVLRNLISNAIKFSFEEKTIITEVKKEDSCFFTISVRDQGQGIPQEELASLFRIDSTVKSKGTNGEDGSGLGLILCKEFAGINKGKIWVESEKGKGSAFYFTLPVSPAVTA